jgi:hypothetical protein
MGSISRASQIVGKGAGRLDQQYQITDWVRTKGAEASEIWRDVDDEYGIQEKTLPVRTKLSDVVEKTNTRVGHAVRETGAYDAARTALGSVGSVAEESGLLDRIETIGRAAEELYGSSRFVIKPYFLPETPDELLRNTRKELTYISACIMQISPGEAEKLSTQFGALVTSKIAGVAASGALLSLVSTFGTAGTGAAIAGLSGAASANATLAWVGGLLGGGMATGAVLTGGISLIVGLGAYKALGSEKRDFDALDKVEQQIVQYCWMLIAIIDDYLERGSRDFSVLQARTFLNSTLIPLQQMLVENETAICANLDRKNSVAYRHHVLRDFDPTVIDAFQSFIEEREERLREYTLHYEYVIGGVLYALMTRSAVDDSIESQLFLDALRRSDLDLTDASEADLSHYLSDYSEEQLKGISNNAKGIYHELMWVEAYNAENTETQAELYGSPNHPGADVSIFDITTGEEVTRYQLKATNNVTYINEHHERYTDIEVISTNEAADRLDNVTASGFDNETLSAVSDDNIDTLAGSTVGNRSFESAGIALTVATGQELVAMLQGRQEFQGAIGKSIEKTATAGAATAIAAYLFS